MRGSRANQLLWVVLTVVFAASLAACSVSMAGGVLGALGTLTVAGLLLLGVSTTQTGCDSEGSDPGDTLEDVGADVDPDIGPCLSVDYIGPCLQPPFDVGPCLGAPLDVGPDALDDVGQLDIGPCLEPPWDVGACLSDIGPDTSDVGIGPCLSPPFDAGSDDAADPDIGPCLDFLPDVGPCLSQIIDAGPADAEGDAGDVWIGPCLSPPFEPDAQNTDAPDSAQAAPAAAPTGRAAAVEKLAAKGALPADVLARLRARDDMRS